MPAPIAEPLLNRMRKNARQIKAYLKRHGISCYRLFDWDMPEFPLCIDVYDGHVHVAEYRTRHALDEDAHRDWLLSCMETVQVYFGLPPEQIFWKTRERQKGIQQYEKVGEKGHFFTVQENGLNFRVNLSDYLDTGLFLDHRPTRQRVREEAAGKHVLNLFAYTGSFSVYACAGGALSTTTVDLSNTYLAWAKENFLANGMPLQRNEFIRADAKEWVKQASPRQYDLVVLDPPTLSRSKMAKSRFDLQLDHVDLIRNTMNRMKPGGVLYFSNNFRGFRFEPEQIPATHIEDITTQTIPDDFRNKKIHACWRIVK